MKPVGRCALVLVASLLAFASAGCGGGGGDDGGGERATRPLPVAPEDIRLRSPVFKDGGRIPALHTCDGVDLSPPLEWTTVPEGTRSIALVILDPDAAGGAFVHWTLSEINNRAEALGEGSVPPKAKEGKNSFGNDEYAGPCPPRGDRPHRYVFALYALRAKSGLDEGASPNEVLEKIEQLALERALLTGRYGR
jgi:Raf kinase inhibitor-like YbhB/YbcL family protein